MALIFESDDGVPFAANSLRGQGEETDRCPGESTFAKIIERLEKDLETSSLGEFLDRPHGELPGPKPREIWHELIMLHRAGPRQKGPLGCGA